MSLHISKLSKPPLGHFMPREDLLPSFYSHQGECEFQVYSLYVVSYSLYMVSLHSLKNFTTKFTTAGVQILNRVPLWADPFKMNTPPEEDVSKSFPQVFIIKCIGSIQVHNQSGDWIWRVLLPPPPQKKNTAIETKGEGTKFLTERRKIILNRKK